MFTNSDFTTAIESAIIQLQSLEKRLGQTACPPITTLTINLQNLSDQCISTLLTTIPTGYKAEDKGTDFVYVMQLVDDNSHTMALLREQFTLARQSAGDYARVNPEHGETTTLYVGRSKTLRSRLRQHLGAGDEKVYALHLERWATSFDRDINICIMAFHTAEDMLVQAIEDGIWTLLRPAFGRKGEK